MPVLEQVGRQLQILLLEILNLPRLDLVLEACPNLIQLRVYTETGPQDAYQLRPDTLKELQKVEYEVSSGYLEAGLLLQILSMAHELRSIKLGSLRFDEDWKALARLAEEGTCMQHLKKIKSKTRFTKLEQRLLARARVSCCINCPRLKIFSAESDIN
jgi:hypothetical protein